MTFKTIVLCVSIILFFITVEHLRYLPKNAIIKKYFRSGFRGRELANRKLFSDYLRRFKKSYEPEEFHKRFRYFKKSLKEIKRLNDGLNHALFGVTKFSDWSQEERFQMLAPQLSETCKGGEKAKNCTKIKRRDEGYRIDGKDRKIPLKWDWRDHDAVTPIFDQKLCPICWAASTAGVMESMAAINGLGLTTLSKQQLIDCTYDEGAEKTGCRHGRPLIDVYENMCNEHIKLTTEAQYPLTFAEEDCKRVHGERGLARFEINCSMHNDEKKLVEAIARGPVTALTDARLLFNYLNGIISYHCKVSEADLNHAVQIVGYDTTAQPPYYIVRNSWGVDWGEKGYARFAIGSNQCGIAYSIGILDVY